VISNATRWDTFEGLMADQQLPESEVLFRWAVGGGGGRGGGPNGWCRLPWRSLAAQRLASGGRLARYQP
jgi:hypothetical protein